MADVPAIASFKPKQREAAKLFAKGALTREVHKELGIPMRTLQSWNASEQFQLLVSMERDRRVVGPVSMAVRRKFGYMTMDDVGENLLDTLVNIANFDPVGLQDEDGRWLPLDKLAPEVRACIKRPGTDKNPPEFYCKQKAGETLAKIVMAYQAARLEMARRREDFEKVGDAEVVQP